MAAITRYGLTGSMANYGTFTAKTASTATGQSPRASRYRFAYRMTDVVRMFILWL